MAYSPIQHKTVTGSGASYTASFTTTPVVGNLLLIAVSSSFAVGSGPCSSITDNQTGNTYTEVTPVGGKASATGDTIQIFYCVVVGASGTFTITANFPGTQEGSSTAIHEYSGNAASPFDKTANNNGSTNAPALAASITPTNANSLVFAAEVDANGDATTISAGTNFTIRETQLTSSTLERIGTEDWIQTTATATTAAFALGASANWALMAAVFSPLVAAANVTAGQKTLLGVGL